MGNSSLVTSGIGNYRDAPGNFKYWPLNNSTVRHIRYWLNKTSGWLHPCAINVDEIHDSIKCMHRQQCICGQLRNMRMITQINYVLYFIDKILLLLLLFLSIFSYPIKQYRSVVFISLSPGLPNHIHHVYVYFSQNVYLSSGIILIALF